VKKSAFMIAGVLGVLAISPMAQATLLGTPPTGLPVLAPSETESPVPNYTGPILGTLVATTGLEKVVDTSVSGKATIDVTFEEEVFKEASGSLDFYYQLKVTGATDTAAKNAPLPAISELDISDYSNWKIEVGTASKVGLAGMGGDGTVVPSSDFRDGTPGDTIEFLFQSPAISTGKNDLSLTMVISTPATTYVAGSPSFVSSQGTSGDLSGFQPGTSPVPEPVSIILGGSVLSLSAFWLRRRRNAVKVKA
jgi:hypothetical protein